MERTLVLIKPDGVQRRLVGEIIKRFESRGLKIVGLKLMQLSEEQAGRHYAEHEGKPFFRGLVEFITSGPLVALVLEGKGCIPLVRKMMGATNPAEADPGSIRGSLAIDTARNVVHGSDSPTSAAREIPIFFEESELCDYRLVLDEWLHE